MAEAQIQADFRSMDMTGAGGGKNVFVGWIVSPDLETRETVDAARSGQETRPTSSRGLATGRGNRSRGCTAKLDDARVFGGSRLTDARAGRPCRTLFK